MGNVEPPCRTTEGIYHVFKVRWDSTKQTTSEIKEDLTPKLDDILRKLYAMMVDKTTKTLYRNALKDYFRQKNLLFGKQIIVTERVKTNEYGCILLVVAVGGGLVDIVILSGIPIQWDDFRVLLGGSGGGLLLPSLSERHVAGVTASEWNQMIVRSVWPRPYYTGQDTERNELWNEAEKLVERVATWRGTGIQKDSIACSRWCKEKVDMKISANREDRDRKINCFVLMMAYYYLACDAQNRNISRKLTEDVFEKACAFILEINDGSLGNVPDIMESVKKTWKHLWYMDVPQMHSTWTLFDSASSTWSHDWIKQAPPSHLPSAHAGVVLDRLRVFVGRIVEYRKSKMWTIIRSSKREQNK